ncbi:MAG: hypothetical protein D6773_03195 [Alphaproteobacteria bacterium]|nr:MAG: hypothetical protein D6773_03195 [Alphaproteobacteria bacterium]
MSKKPSLSTALRGLETRDTAPAVSPTPEAETGGGGGKTALPPSRQGKKTIAGHFDPAVSRQLRALGLEHDRTVQDLLSEALNGLFEKYGKPPIA